MPVSALGTTTLLSQVVLIGTACSEDAFNFALDLIREPTLIAFPLPSAVPKLVLVSFTSYAPATVLFVIARREQGRQLFSARELVLLAASVVGALIGTVALAAGRIHL